MQGESLFCADLSSAFQPQIGRILVTGASGYIGGRLVPELLARGYRVRIMVRAPSPEYALRWPGAEIVVADALDQDQLARALEGIDTAYYLLHSLLRGPKEFEGVDLRVAKNFRVAAEGRNVRRIIYLGGLGDTRGVLSSHLRSRMEIAQELRSGKTPVTILRAAIIIGSGSASYEIIYHLVRKLPFILLPEWAKSKCQPIAVRDVIKYLVGVLEIPQTAGKSFDIGGRSVLTYQRMLKLVALLLNKKTVFIPSFFSDINIYAYVASLYTPVPAPIIQCLLEGASNEVVCQENSIHAFLPFTPLSFKESIVRAISRVEQDTVATRWSDAYPPAHELALKLHEIAAGISYTKHSSLVTSKEAGALFRSICMIGGKQGWFHTNWLWRLRGALDRLLGGVGTARGRKSQTKLEINDVIDFWRVEDLQPGKRLLLRAEMKLPGRAWLEFNIDDIQGARKLSVTAYYDTDSAAGRVYWFLCYPFHLFIFDNLIRTIEKRS